MGLHNDIDAIAKELGDLSLVAGSVIVTAESCTGGWVAKTLTDIPGSSAWFDRGFVAYTNEAKQEMLGVQPETLATHGAVSEQTTLEMAQGAIKQGRGTVTVAISGIAGPSGAMPGKPVGTVWFAWVQQGGIEKTCCKHFAGSRGEIRHQAAACALRGLIEVI
ncbi:Nicotinamide-nucleotide amidase [hydrothermal vent metagenome]|uniref:Nicotinamide-nucleotide amidase n=1 Tax=hydrothermal vent metagenome TaxID=652676 RepID=A0A3B1BG58_9ZZZZ